MSLPDVLGAVLVLALTAYAVLGGADFGAGVLDAAAGADAGQRTALAEAMGPVWEANHVWLILAITVLFSAFPAAFAAMGAAFLAPLTLALLAIVIRGAAFGLRAEVGATAKAGVALRRLFGLGSVAAPFFFGTAAGGLALITGAPGGAASGAARAVPWTDLFGLATGALAVAACAHLAASQMAATLQGRGQPALAEQFRRRGLQTGAAVVALASFGLLLAAWRHPSLAQRLVGIGLPAVLAGAAGAAASILALIRRRHRIARAGAQITMTALLWGLVAIQAPRLIGPRLTLQSSAASSPALVAVAIAVGLTLLLVVPAMFLLFGFSRQLPTEEVR
jgi:cytochrome d ubiquinol oxidase subunit II